MKSSRTFLFALFLLALPAALFAAKNSKEITLDKTTKVGSTELQPGTYRIEWNGAGPQVQVNFTQDKKNVATTTAKLVNARGPYESAVQVQTDGNNAAVLQEIDFKNLQLIFPQSEQPSGN